MLWTDKYRPKDLESLDYLKDQAADLKNLAKDDDFPHLLVHGPLGAGKSTRIKCILKAIYGPGAEKLKAEQMSFTTPSHVKLEITTLASNYHIEVNPSDVDHNDRVVVMEVIKNVAQAQQLNTSTQRSFKVIVLKDADNLTQDAQHALRRTMEKYVSTCRIILCVTSTSSVIPAIRSRCLCLRVPAPSHDTIIKILNNVAQQEGLNLPEKLAQNIAEKSNRNLRRALLMLQTCKVQQYPFTDNQRVDLPDWKVCIANIAGKIIKQPTIETMAKVRENFYELLANGIGVRNIFGDLVDQLLEKGDVALFNEIVEFAAKFELAAVQGDKAIVHLEAFAARCMCIYQNMLKEMMDFDM